MIKNENIETTDEQNEQIVYIKKEKLFQDETPFKVESFSNRFLGLCGFQKNVNILIGGEKFTFSISPKTALDNVGALKEEKLVLRKQKTRDGQNEYYVYDLPV